LAINPHGDKPAWRLITNQLTTRWPGDPWPGDPLPTPEYKLGSIFGKGICSTVLQHQY